MPRTFFHDVTLEVLLCGNSFELVATVEFTATPVVPATYWQPSEGGEVEVLKVIDLFVPEVKERAVTRMCVPLKDGEFVDVPAVKAKPRIDIDPIPPALAELILVNVDEESLFESVDFDGDDREYEYDPRD